MLYWISKQELEKAVNKKFPLLALSNSRMQERRVRMRNCKVICFAFMILSFGMFMASQSLFGQSTAAWADEDEEVQALVWGNPSNEIFSSLKSFNCKDLLTKNGIKSFGSLAAADPKKLATILVDMKVQPLKINPGIKISKTVTGLYPKMKLADLHVDAPMGMAKLLISRAKQLSPKMAIKVRNLRKIVKKPS